MEKSALIQTTGIYAGKKAQFVFSGSVILILSVFMTYPLNGYAQSDLSNIKIWEGWKIGNVIKISGSVKYGNPLIKADEDKRYLVVKKIDDIALESSRSIEILYHKEFFSTLKDGETVTLLGYVSGGFHGIPKFNDYDLEYWQDASFQFDLYFVVLKVGDAIIVKKK